MEIPCVAVNALRYGGTPFGGRRLSGPVTNMKARKRGANRIRYPVVPRRKR